MSDVATTVLRQQSLSNKADWLLLMLHGVGASAHDLFRLTRELANHFPTIAFAAPNGFDTFDHNPSGRQWFSITGVTEGNREERLRPVTPKLNALIDKEAARIELDKTGVILLGFSQGTIMALHLVAMGVNVAGVVGMSGRLAGSVSPRNTWPVIHLIHGTADPIMPLAVARQTVDWLSEAGSCPHLTEIPGLAHQIDARALTAAIASINSILDQKGEIGDADAT